MCKLPVGEGAKRSRAGRSRPELEDVATAVGRMAMGREEGDLRAAYAARVDCFR